MTKGKNTKRALLTSVLSMMLCMAMLITSTFAWFTDSVTSGKNKIVAGNLDVELYHTNSKVTTDEKVSTETPLFTDKDGEDILWEPGVMVYENFTVKNVGTLALKYKLTVNVGEFNTVDNGKSLKDVLKVAILEEAFTGDRDAAQKLVFDKTIAEFEKEGALAPETAGDTYAVVIYWEPSAADNDYNLNNGKKADDDTDKLYIDLGINLTATQNTVEKDSFDEQYDKNAWFDLNATDNKDGTYENNGKLYVKDNNNYVAVTKSETTKGLYTAENGDYYAATPEAVNKVVGDGGSVTLMNDINAGIHEGERFNISSGTTINGNGKVLTTSGPAYLGNRVIDIWKVSDPITIKNTIVTGDTKDGDPSYLTYGLGMWDSPNATLNITNSTIEAGHYALGVQGKNNNATVTITNSTLKGYCAFQTFSPKTQATFEDSHIIGINQWSGKTDNFAAVCVMFDEYNNDYATDSVLTFNNCTIEATEQGTAKERFFSLRTGCTLNINGCTFMKNGVTVSTDDIIQDIQNATQEYVYIEGDGVSIFVDGVKVK